MPFIFIWYILIHGIWFQLYSNDSILCPPSPSLSLAATSCSYLRWLLIFFSSVIIYIPFCCILSHSWVINLFSVSHVWVYLFVLSQYPWLSAEIALLWLFLVMMIITVKFVSPLAAGLWLMYSTCTVVWHCSSIFLVSLPLLMLLIECIILIRWAYLR